uniref:Uncharacterized protein n=1 Tax=Macaca fascicularis TaxID=9541 RepID=A0A7N9CLM0_MACFA
MPLDFSDSQYKMHPYVNDLHFFAKTSTKEIILFSDYYLKANKPKTQIKPDCYFFLSFLFFFFFLRQSCFVAQAGVQ